MNKILKLRDFPNNYPQEVVDLFHTMAFSKGKGLKIGGTASLRSMLYSADYDGIQSNVSLSPKGFQEIIERLMARQNCYIGDIKWGIKTEWKILPEALDVQNGKLVGYDRASILQGLDRLKKEKVLSEAEVKHSKDMLVEIPSLKQAFEIIDAMRFEIVRWTPDDVLKGETRLRDGSVYTLQDGIDSKGMMKLDVVAFLDGRYKECSLIYRQKGQISLSQKLIVHDLKLSILETLLSGNYFKAMKRIFSVAKIEKNKKVLELLLPILNGDMGILYTLLSDVKALLFLEENNQAISKEKYDYEIDQFRSRLGNMYQLDGIFEKERTILKNVLKAQDAKAKSIRMSILYDLEALLEETLKYYGEDEFKRIGFVPLPASFRP